MGNNYDLVQLERSLEDSLEAVAGVEFPHDLDHVFNEAVRAIISDEYSHYQFNVEQAVFRPDAALTTLPSVFHMAFVVAPSDANYLPPAVANAYRCSSPTYVCAITSDYFGDIPMPLAAQGSTLNHAVLASLLRYFLASLRKGGLRDAH